MRMIKDRKYSREFLFKKKEEQTITDVICYFEQREIETRYMRKSSLAPPPDFRVRPPEDFFTPELLEKARPVLLESRIRKQEEHINTLSRELILEMDTLRRMNEELDALRS